MSLKHTLSMTVRDIRSAERMTSPLFSASKLDVMALRMIDEAPVGVREITSWERSRSVNLPWIGELSVEQVAQLRIEAADALPRFRESFLRALMQPPDNDRAAIEAIQRLRAEAEEVASELKALNVTRGSSFRTTAGLLGVTASVYGFGSGFVPPAGAIGGLLSLLGLLHGSARKDEQDEAKLRSKPGYVLLKARELLDHDAHKS
jgi:hypothetical protein